MGDLNIHHRSWLRFSSRGDTAMGKHLEETVSSTGLKQLVKEPTRQDNLLDLVLTDLLGVSVDVGGKLKEDHRWITATIPITVPTTERVERTVWNYRDADWDRLNADLSETDWEFLRRMPPDEATVKLTEIILERAREAIGQRNCKELKSSHPWLTDEIVICLKAKRDAEGTVFERERAEECSAKIVIAREGYIKRIKRELTRMWGNAQQWWKKTNTLMGAPAKTCSIPPLKNTSNEWVLEAADKATLIAETQLRKCVLSEEKKNEYTKIKQSTRQQDFLQSPTEEMAYKALSELTESSAT